MPSIFYQTALRALSHISDDKLAKLNALQNGILAKLLTEAARLMEGLPTQNISVQDLVPKVQDSLDKTKAMLSEVQDLIKQKDGTFSIQDGGALPPEAYQV